MAKRNDFQNIEDLYFALIDDIEDSMRNNVDKKIKNIYKSHAEQSYKEYQPKTNNSRFRNGVEGSFADEINFKEEVIVDGDMLTYELENHRETDCDCAYCRSKRIRLDQYIEEGIANNKRILEKKVYEKSQIQIDNEIENMIKTDLIRKGW